MLLSLTFPPVGPEWVFLMLVLVILGGPLAARALRLPGMIGQIIGGLIIGPHVLGWVEREGTVEGVGTIGLLYLMFLAGVELDLDDFNRNRTRALRFGLATFSIPLVLGIAVGFAFGYGTAAAVLFGSLWASHTLLAYPAVREAGLVSNRAVSTAVGGTVLTDTLALFVLAVVAGSVEGASGVRLVVQLSLGVAVLLATTLIVMPLALRAFFTRVSQERTVRFLAILATMTASALLAHVVGLEGIVGAFFAGLGVNRLVPNHGVLMERLEFFGSSLLVPVFLISTGMLIDPSKFLDARTLELAAAALGVVVVGKYTAAVLAGRSLGFTPAEIMLCFTLSVAQAAATLASVIIGHEIGLFGDDLVNASLVVVLVSVLIATLGTAATVSRVPTSPPIVGQVFANLMVAITPRSGDAILPIAGRLARGAGGSVTPLLVIGDGDDHSAAEAELARATAVVAATGADAEPLLRIAPSAGVGTLRAAAERHASLILVDYRAARAATDALREAAGVEVIAAARIPIAILTTDEEEAPTRVVLAIDDGGGPELQTAQAVAEAVAEQLARTYDLEPERHGGTLRDVVGMLDRGALVVIARALAPGTLDAGIEAAREAGTRLAIVLAPEDGAAYRVLDAIV
jgi:Kef-type K+ transport system membrane component KefB